MRVRGALKSSLLVIISFVAVYSLLLLIATIPPAPGLIDPRLHFESQVTALVKVHKRPDIAVRAAFSVYELYPSMHILMVDDSPSQLDLPLPPTATYHRIPEDTGISFGRNFGVQKIHTPYTLLLDDDWLITNQSNLEDVFALMESNHSLGIVAGLLCNKEPINDCYGYKGSLGIVDKKLSYRDNVAREIMQNNCKLVDLGENAMLARTDVLKAFPWDNRLKNAEHEDFYLSLKGKVNVAHCPWFKILHKRPHLAAYAGYQYDRNLWANQNILCEKWSLEGFDMMWTEWQRKCPTKG